VSDGKKIQVNFFENTTIDETFQVGEEIAVFALPETL
jgi:hypothetical protein